MTPTWEWLCLFSMCCTKSRFVTRCTECITNTPVNVIKLILYMIIITSIQTVNVNGLINHMQTFKLIIFCSNHKEGRHKFQHVCSFRVLYCINDKSIFKSCLWHEKNVRLIVNLKCRKLCELVFISILRSKGGSRMLVGYGYYTWY